MAPEHEAAALPLPPPDDPQGSSRVLVICSGDRLLPENILFDESLRRAIESGARAPIEFCGEFLDEVRFPSGYEQRMRDLLEVKYRERPPEVVVAFASPSLDFCLRNREQVFPDAPIVFAGLGSDSLGSGPLQPGVTGVRSSFDGPATLRLALRLHPHARQVYLIVSDSGPDSVGIDRAILQALGPAPAIRTLKPHSLPHLLDDLSALPANSVVIDLFGLGRTAGSAGRPQDAMQGMSQASPAPIYGMFDPLVGFGLVGTVTTPLDAIGRATGAQVLHILSSSDPDRLPEVQDLAAVPLVDWRQLRRWNSSKIELPRGTIVRFEPPSFWRQHLLLVITLGALFLLQSGLILALVLQSRRRQRAELESRWRREELAHMTRVATMGELTASLAHEINQPLAAILSNAQAAMRLLASGDGDLTEIREILDDIASDDRRAGEVIRRMRSLLRKEEFHPSELDVNDLVDEVVGIVRAEMILQNVSLALELSPQLRRVQGDRVQLQQVLLNLVVNALDAMKEAVGGNRRLVIRTAAASGLRSVEISVQDSGVGMPLDKLEKIWDPFVTTKPHGMGLGLAICRSIVQAHGGRIGSRNNPDRGATFWVTLPALEEVKA
jgi:signal transduction histidine kinase